jgi:hypothetical protein
MCEVNSDWTVFVVACPAEAESDLIEMGPLIELCDKKLEPKNCISKEWSWPTIETPEMMGVQAKTSRRISNHAPI